MTEVQDQQAARQPDWLFGGRDVVEDRGGTYFTGGALACYQRCKLSIAHVLYATC